jgi:hypothetical protein
LPSAGEKWQLDSPVSQGIRNKWPRTATQKKAVGVFVLLAVAQSGCAKPPFSTIESQIDGLKGEPIKTVIDKLGEPMQSETGSENAYVWVDNSDVDRTLGFRCTIRVFT